MKEEKEIPRAETKIKIIESDINRLSNHESVVNNFCKSKIILTIETLIKPNYQASSNSQILSVITYSESNIK